MSIVNVNSIGSLEDLEASMMRFASETKNAIEAAQREIQKKTELLDQIVAERRRAVSVLQAACDDGDDEHSGCIEKQLEEAEDDLREAKKWQRRVEEACAEYQKHESRADHLAGKHADRSRIFLKARIAELYKYISFKPHSSRSIAGASQSQGSGSSEVGAITSLPLPAGFSWLNLDEVDMERLPAEGDYRKGISEAEMKDGLELLQTRVLPEIQKEQSAATIEHFLELDVAEGRSGSSSLANIFASYFGDSNIYVSRYQGDRYFKIGNGRHRIKAAKDLGWNAVPARVVEVPRPAN
jgi:hypothetical protein